LGKVKHLLVSGDNHAVGYDEPSDMKQAVLALGVPESAVTLDYAGFRTLDSIVRAKEVFGQTKLTIVTDRFHAYRAVFIARHCGIEAVAYCSAEVPVKWSAEARLRECGARVKAVLDLFVLNTHPRFLGPKEEIRV
jgi:SanA protein